MLYILLKIRDSKVLFQLIKQKSYNLFYFFVMTENYFPISLVFLSTTISININSSDECVNQNHHMIWTHLVKDILLRCFKFCVVALIFFQVFLIYLD